MAGASKSVLDKVAAGAGIVLLYGNEPGPLRQCLLDVRKAVLEPGFEDFNHERFAGRELDSIGPVLEACSQLPLMAAKRLVELADPELVGKRKAGSDAAKTSQAALVDYLKAPNPSTVLVLTSAGIDGRSKLVTATKKSGVVLKFEQLRRDRDAVDFLRNAAREQGLRIDGAAAGLLVELAGTGQSSLLAALERASLHAGADTAVTSADVRAVAGNSRQAVIFDLTDAVGLGQRDKALAVLAHLFEESTAGEIGQANQTLAMLIRQIRLVFTAKYAPHPREIASRCKVPPFIAQKLAAQADGFDEARLRRAYAGLARLDRDLKGGSVVTSKSPYLALQRWILDVCQAMPGAAGRT